MKTRDKGLCWLKQCDDISKSDHRWDTNPGLQGEKQELDLSTAFMPAGLCNKEYDEVKQFAPNQKVTDSIPAAKETHIKIASM